MHRILTFLLFFTLPLVAKESDRTFVVARDATWAPYDLGNETYNVTGFTASLLREIGKVEGATLDLQEANQSSLFKGLCDGTYEGIFSAVPPDDAQREKFDFSTPVLMLGPVLVVKEESDIKKLNDLKGSKVGLSAFDRSVLIAQKVPTLQIQLYQSMPEALKDLSQGKIEGVLMGTLQAHALVYHLYSGKLRIATPPLSDDAVRLVTLKGKGKPLVSLFNHGVKKLKKSGYYARLRLEYGVN